MAITVDSSQWTGERDDMRLETPVVWGSFSDDAARDRAMAQLHAEGERPDARGATDKAAPLPPAENGGVDVPDNNPEEADQRNQRQLGVGMSMAAAAMGAAGLVIASGGALLPAVAAAVAGGAGAGALGEAVAAATQPDMDDGPMAAPLSGPVIGIRAKDEATRRQAEDVLRELGAIQTVYQDHR